jgi:peptidoglycan hydrolase-like protein with peptidoglycan-binding domain
MSKQTIARFAGVSAGLTMALGFAGGVGAQTVAELQAQIAALMAQLAALSGGSSSGAAITSDLTIGSSGPQVVTLQNALVAQGHLVMPAGVAPGYFGALTQAAVAKWQAANGLPATGYFGPLSRAKFGGGVTTGGSTSGGVVVGGGSGPLMGGEGSLDVNGNLGDVEAEVDEDDEDVQVLGVELEADDSDIMIERVDVDFTVGSGGSSQLDDYITEVTLWLDGQRLATLDVDEGDEDSNDVFSFRFSGLRGVIREGDEAELYVAVSAVSNIDSGDTSVDISVDVPADGIRAVDAAGITDTYATAGEVTAETFNVVEPTSGDLTVSEAPSNPDAMDVEIDDDDTTEDVVMLVFELEAEEQDVTVDDIEFDLAVSAGGVSNTFSSLALYQGSTLIDTMSVTAAGTSTVFTDLDIEIDADDTETFTIKADINDVGTGFASGQTASVTIDSSAIDAEDAQGDSITVTSSDVSGGTITFRTAGIEVELNSITESITPSDSAPDLGTYVFKFDVTAFGNDVFLSGTTTDTATLDETNSVDFVKTGGGSATSTLTCSGCEESSNAFEVSENTTEEFTLTVIVSGSGGFADIEIDKILWGTTAAHPYTTTTEVDDWESDQQFLSAT